MPVAMDPGPIAHATANDAPLTPLDPRHARVLRAGAAIALAPLLIGALVMEAADVLWPGAALLPVLALIAWFVGRMPGRRYRARGYALADDSLRVVRGLWFHSDTIVPFGRVQHIDVGQGPIERRYGLATLVLHTAGQHNAAVPLPGLAYDTALAMRDTIRAHVRREAM